MVRHEIPISKAFSGTWVQTQRAAHEDWAVLLRDHPAAAQLMHLLVARVGDHNAVVISQNTLASLMGKSRDTVKRAVATLRERKWVEIRQIGERGTVNAYVLNDRVVWSGPREGIRYSLFSATVITADNEQPDRHELGDLPPLRQLPSLFPGERQLPTGPGKDPPSEPPLPGMEPDLPSRSGARQVDIEDALADQRQR
jgi:biotin operon repressor